MREHGLLVIDSVESDAWRRRVMADVSDDDSSQLIYVMIFNCFGCALILSSSGKHQQSTEVVWRFTKEFTSCFIQTTLTEGR